MKRFALIYGIVFLLIGVMGLIPGLITETTHEGVAVNALEGDLLGIFPVNIVHTLVHLVIGLWGLLASRSWDASYNYAKGTAIIYGLITLMGLIPGLNTLFGLAPIHGADVVLHLLATAVSLYFWLVVGRRADRTTAAV